MYKSSTRFAYTLPARLGVLAVEYESRTVFFLAGQ